MEEGGSSEVVLSGKVSLSEKVVLVLLAVEAGAVKEGFGFLPSRRVRVLEGGQRRINLASSPDYVHGRQSTHGSSWFWVCRCLTGRSGQDSLHA